jgi:hypothetical protein
VPVGSVGGRILFASEAIYMDRLIEHAIPGDSPHATVHAVVPRKFKIIWHGHSLPLARRTAGGGHGKWYEQEPSYADLCLFFRAKTMRRSPRSGRAIRPLSGPLPVGQNQLRVVVRGVSEPHSITCAKTEISPTISI